MMDDIQDMTTNSQISMQGRTILVVEDEAMLALDLSFELEDAGAMVETATNLKDAVAACTTSNVDGAILDVDLRGHDVYPAAEILMARGIPFLFHTGHAKASDIAERFPGAPVISKPAGHGLLRHTIGGLIDAAAQRAPSMGMA